MNTCRGTSHASPGVPPGKGCDPLGPRLRATGERRTLDGRLSAAQAWLAAPEQQEARVGRYSASVRSSSRLEALGATPSGQAEVFRARVDRVVWGARP